MRWIVVGLLLASGLFGQSLRYYYGPIVNAASAWRWGEIAPGSLFVVRGAEIGPREPLRAEGRLRAELGGTSIRISSGDKTFEATIAYASSGLIAGVLPSDVPVGDASFTVTSKAGTTAPAPLRVLPRAFAVFTQDGRGAGPALAQNVDRETGEYRLNTFTNSARPGQTVVLWGTGLGTAAADDLQLWVGSTAIHPSYAGASGCCEGIDQVTFEIPQGVDGCFVPVTAGRNAVTISVAREGGACADRHNLPAAELERAYPNLQVGGGIHLRGWSGSLMAEARFPETIRSLPSIGSCSVDGAIFPEPLPLWSIRKGAELSAGRDAGSPLTMRGPGGSVQLPQEFAGVYQDRSLRVLPSWIPGEYSFDNGPGGRDIGPFRLSAAVPSSTFRWTNKANPTEYHFLDAADDLTVEWEGADANREFVFFSAFNDDGLIAEPDYFGFTCVERADKGRFTIPSRVLDPMRHSGSKALYLSVSVISFPQSFSARGLDLGWLTVETTDSLGYRFR